MDDVSRAGEPARYALGRLRGIARPPLRIGAPPSGIATDWDVAVPVRDGTVLRVNVFRPAGGARAPVIMSAHPYGKDRLPARGRAGYRAPAQYRMLRQPVPVAFSAWTGWEAPDPAYWVVRGYAVVNCDLRGCGTSDGVGSVLSDQEAEDYFDLIEWAAAQPWSTGKVGLNGVSYLAISQYKVAALRPPALAAICPWEGFTDAYRDLLRPGGIREDGFIRMWTRGLRGQRLEYDLRHAQFERPLRDEWWRSLVPDLGRIEAPMLVCGSFSDHCLHSAGSFRAFEQTGSAQRWIYTHRAGKWATYYSPDALAAQLRFFDHFLKGADNGQAEQPRVRLAIHDVRDAPAELRGEQEWPLARTEWRRLHLLPDGRLALEPGSAEGEVAFDLRSGAAVFRWSVPERLELSGPMAAHLQLELRGAGDANLFVGVEKWRDGRPVHFEGSYGYGLDRVTTGWLRASHRPLDTALSQPWAPVHTHVEPHPVAPADIVAVDVALRPSATRFEPRDELRLVIRGRWLSPRNPAWGQLPAAYEGSGAGTAVLHCGGTTGAHLLVPAVA
jgi:predicted acyl esterase